MPLRDIDNNDVSFGSVFKLLKLRVEEELDVSLDDRSINIELEQQLADHLYETLTSFLDENLVQEMDTLEYESDDDDSRDPEPVADISRDIANETISEENPGVSFSDDDLDVSLYQPPDDSPAKDGRRKLTYEQEDKVIAYIRAHPNHKIKTLRKNYRFLSKLDDSSIYRLMARARAPNETSGERKRKFIRLAEAMHIKFEHIRDFDKDQVDGDDLKEWALIFAEELQLTNFVACDTFIQKWKTKHRIGSRKVTNFISKRQVRDKVQKEADAKNFGLAIKKITEEEGVNPRFIFNADQTGVPYEMARNRTLNRRGDKYVFCKVKSRGNMKNSFTAMILVTADGSIWPKTLLCLKEPTGRFGARVMNSIYKPRNIELTCTRSGKFTSSTFEYWVETILESAVRYDEKCLVLLDSWAPHKNNRLYSSLEDKNYEVHIIPPGTTALCQPLDVYFNRQFKDLMKYIHHKIRLRTPRGGGLDRNVVISAVSLALFIMAAPRFKVMVRYAFIKSGLLNQPKENFSRPLETCRIIAAKSCDFDRCENYANLMCPWCEKNYCIHCIIGMQGIPHMTRCEVYEESWERN